jgi:ABC-2 type transport system permease protein
MDVQVAAPRSVARDARDENLGLGELVALYFRLVGARTRGLMQYKLSFAAMTAASLAGTGADYVGVRVLFGRIPQLAGFSFPDIAFIFGLTLVCFALAEIPTPGFELLPRLIVQGGFDRVLTRPLGAFYQTLASDVSPRKLLRGLLGLAIMFGAQSAIPIQWTPERALVIALAVPSGAAIFFCVFVCGAASTFWTVQANEVVNVFTNGGVALLTYPLDVYHDWLKRFVTFVVPLGFVSYYPALYALGRADPLGLPSWVGFLSPLAAAIFSIVAWIAWSLGVRHYASVGN